MSMRSGSDRKHGNKEWTGSEWIPGRVIRAVAETYELVPVFDDTYAGPADGAYLFNIERKSPALAAAIKCTDFDRITLC